MLTLDESRGFFFVTTEEMWKPGDPGSNVVGQVRWDGEDRFDSLPEFRGLQNKLSYTALG